MVNLRCSFNTALPGRGYCSLHIHQGVQRRASRIHCGPAHFSAQPSLLPLHPRRPQYRPEFVQPRLWKRCWTQLGNRNNKMIEVSNRSVEKLDNTNELTGSIFTLKSFSRKIMLTESVGGLHKFQKRRSLISHLGVFYFYSPKNSNNRSLQAGSR